LQLTDLFLAKHDPTSYHTRRSFCTLLILVEVGMQRILVFTAVLCLVLCAIVTEVRAQSCGDADWVASTGTVPSARSGAAMVWDSYRSRLVLYGGKLSGGTFSNATWEFDGSNWQQVTTSGSPGGRAFHAMAYDSTRHVTVLYGGLTSNGTVMDDTYEYNGATWTLRSTLTSAARREYHSMAFDASRNRVVMFGGQNNTTLIGTTFEYNGTDWIQVQPPAAPSARTGCAMAYDSARHVVVLHGGRVSPTTESYSSQTWEWNGSVWTMTTDQGMSDRAGHCMAYDAHRARMVVFGGFNPTGHYFSSTWEYDGASWTQRSTTTTPSAKAWTAAAFDPVRARVVLEGGGYGADGTLASSDAWELAATAGNTPVFSTQPTPLQLHSGDQAVFHAALSAGSPVTWQWKKGTTVLTNSEHISGVSTSTLTITSVTNADAGAYFAVATNACGAQPSTAASLSLAPACGTADFNGDGDIGTDADIESFFACLAGNCCLACGSSDFNADGDIGTDADIEAFFRVLAGGTC
jgi:hypothetical protein